MGKSSFRLKRFCSKNVMLKVFIMEDCFFFLLRRFSLKNAMLDFHEQFELENKLFPT
jgi:hypothetical protein